MSYYDDSSLFLSPNGYKTSVLFAQKPMDANGQLAFTRSNDTATRVGPNGLIEKVRTNLVLQSETFQTTWSAQTVSITANATIAPNGTLTADKLVAAVGLGLPVQHRLDQTPTTAAGNNTFSVYAKKGEIEFIFLRIGSSGAMFNLNNGVISSITAGIVASSVDAGNGWYRLIITKAASIANEVLRINLNQTDTFTDFVGNGTDGAFIWGAQYELNDIATDYIPTTTAAVSVGPVANVPRLDYLGSSCPRLLLEPQRTNLMTFSEQFDNATWTKLQTSLTANSIVSPDGFTNADTLTANGTSNEHQMRSTGVVTLTSGTTYTTSIFAKAGTNNFVQLIGSGSTYSATTYANFNIATGVLGDVGAGTTASIVAYGNGWYRCSMTAAANATSSTNTFLCSIVTSNTAIRGESNTLSTNVYLYGAQLEAGAYATSYIPTLGASVTRGADSGCGKTGISSLIGQAEGTLFVEVDLTPGRNNTGAGNGMLEVLDSGRANAVSILKSSTANQILIALRVNSVNTFITAGAYISGTNKIAVAYKSGQNVCYVNGVLAATNSLSFTFSASLDAVNVGAYTTNVIDDRLSQALLFKTRLSNSELAQLTTI